MAYFTFIFQSFIIVGMLFTPSAIFNSWTKRGALITPFSPVVGICVLAVIGLLVWRTDPAYATYIRWITIAAYIAAATITVIFAFRTKKRVFSAPYFTLIATLLVFTQAIAVGVNPLPISQEFNSGSPQPGRMIASPPDHGIPYTTADYFRHGYDGKEYSKEYFGEWGVASRGPLVPLGINALFNVFGVVSDTPISENNWPISARGEHIASIYGWLLNSLVILGVFKLASSLTGDKRRIAFAVVWAALAPVVLVNTVFTWPKLLATYFVLLAVATTIERRMFLTGFLMALAWLSHPVGALMIPAVGLFTLFFVPRDGRNWLVSTCMFFAPAAFTGALMMAPWLAFKAWVAAPDPFAGYIFGRGTGFEPAQNLGEWIAPRLSNLWYTLVPFKFFLDGQMSAWLYGPLNALSRWLSQYAKSLPGQLGFAAFLYAYISTIVRQKGYLPTTYLSCLLIAALLIMDVFWGFSGDGLGRNSLEPVSVLFIVFAAIYGVNSAKIAPYLLTALACENLFLGIGQFLADNTFTVGNVTHEALYCFAIMTICPAVLLMLHLLEESKEASRENETQELRKT